MKFPFNCPGCGYENHAEWAQIAREVICGWCRRSITVPAPMEIASADTEPGLAIRFGCPACGRKYASKLRLAGQKIRCSGCGAGVRVPVGNSIVAANPSRVVLNPHSISRPSYAPAVAKEAAFEVVDDDRVEQDQSMSLREQLASAGALRRREKPAVVLPTRAETLEKARQDAADQAAAVAQDGVAAEESSDKTKRGKKKKRKRKSDFDVQETLTLMGGVGVVVAGLGLVAYYFPDFRYFLGGLVAVIGFILYILGGRSLRELAAMEGFVKLQLYRFFPPYQLWFVLTHWNEARDFFAFFVAGGIVMAIGGAVISTSPTFKKAAENEREYRKAVREAVYGELQPARQPIAPPPAPKPEEETKK
jgi:hypothetical protein